MKKKLTMWLAFATLAGSTLFGAYVYSNAHAGKPEQCLTTEIAGLAYTTECITDCEEYSKEKTQTVRQQLEHFKKRLVQEDEDNNLKEIKPLSTVEAGSLNY